MAKAILDLFIEKGYPYVLNLDMNDVNGEDLENDYSCYFENDSIGLLQFTVSDDRYHLEMSETDTNKLTSNLQEYVVYTINTLDSKPAKLLSGRIHIDERVRT